MTTTTTTTTKASKADPRGTSTTADPIEEARHAHAAAVSTALDRETALTKARETLATAKAAYRANQNATTWERVEAATTAVNRAAFDHTIAGEAAEEAAAAVARLERAALEAELAALVAEPALPEDARERFDTLTKQLAAARQEWRSVHVSNEVERRKKILSLRHRLGHVVAPKGPPTCAPDEISMVHAMPRYIDPDAVEADMWDAPGARHFFLRRDVD